MFFKMPHKTDMPILRSKGRCLLTDGGYDGGDEVEGPGEVPSGPVVVHVVQLDVRGQQRVQVGLVDGRVGVEKATDGGAMSLALGRLAVSLQHREEPGAERRQILNATQQGPAQVSAVWTECDEMTIRDVKLLRPDWSRSHHRTFRLGLSQTVGPDFDRWRPKSLSLGQF